MVNLTDILLAGLILSIGLLWWRAQGLKQLAYIAASSYCRRVNVQLLDQTVAFERVGIERDSIRLRYVYSFEFATTGELRYRGTVVMLGKTVKSIVLEPHRVD